MLYIIQVIIKKVKLIHNINLNIQNTMKITTNTLNNIYTDTFTFDLSNIIFDSVPYNIISSKPAVAEKIKKTKHTMPLNVHNYKIDGFQKVCDITLHDDNFNFWRYENINESLMYADHRSWVYFIVEDDTIIKVGETGNPLGIRKNTSGWFEIDPQPLTGSKCRTGRYINGDGTDKAIREQLFESMYNEISNYSFWAKKCEYIETPFTIWGNSYNTIATVHKDLEKQYLDFIVEHTKSLPRLNKGRA